VNLGSGGSGLGRGYLALDTDFVPTREGVKAQARRRKGEFMLPI
jgi:hypothetical protein